MAAKTGYVGPHTFYAMPGRMLVQGLSNTKDGGGVTGMALYSNKGEIVATYPMPTADGADGYGYDIAINPQKNVMLTSSFTGKKNYMRPLGELVKDADAMKNFGNTMAVWDLKAMKPKKVLSVPGAPLEIRWSLKDGDNWAIVATALTSKLWLVEQQPDGRFAATAVADVGDPSKTPLPVDISLSADDRFLFVSSFMDGMVRVFDVSDPHKPRVAHEQKIGAQVNMVSESWDGERVYFTSSLLANWDKKGKANEQYLAAYRFDGKKLSPLVDSAQAGAAEALYGIGATLTRRGGEDLALVYLQLSLYLQPTHPMALLSLADLYESVKKPQMAIKVYERVPANSPLKSLAEATDKQTMSYSTNGSTSHNIVLAFVSDLGTKAKPTSTGGPPAREGPEL